MSHIQWVLDILRAHGQKLTKTREAIALFLVTHKGIFSPNEVIAHLAPIDKVTVYRVLDLFEALDIIHPVLTHHGEQHYEVHGTRHHHHVVCTGCERSSCVDCEVSRTKAKGFTHIHHSVVYTGLCDTCAR